MSRDDPRPPLDQPTQFMPVTCPNCETGNVTSAHALERDVTYDGQPVLVYLEVTHVRIGTGPHTPGKGTEKVPSQDWLEPHYEYRCPRCRYVESHERLVADRR